MSLSQLVDDERKRKQASPTVVPGSAQVDSDEEERRAEQQRLRRGTRTFVGAAAGLGDGESTAAGGVEVKSYFDILPPDLRRHMVGRIEELLAIHTWRPLQRLTKTRSATRSKLVLRMCVADPSDLVQAGIYSFRDICVDCQCTRMIQVVFGLWACYYDYMDKDEHPIPRHSISRNPLSIRQPPCSPLPALLKKYK